jgi:divalent metal cation (Fe/Co/Zn/Cd) transporter
VAVVKLIAAAASGSSALYAEFAHSVSRVGDQMIGAVAASPVGTSA